MQTNNTFDFHSFSFNAYTLFLLRRFNRQVCFHSVFHFFSYFLHSLALGFDLFHIQCNIFWSWMSATIKNDSPAKTPSISALLGFHKLVCARKHTRGGGPAAHNVNQSSIAVSEQVATCWVQKGHSEECSQSLSIIPPSSVLEGTLKGQFFHGVCVLRRHLGHLLTVMALWYWFIILFNKLYGWQTSHQTCWHQGVISLEYWKRLKSA